jgi:hypothetical protein
MTAARPRACTRILAADLAAAVALQPLAVHAAAILETLAEVPIQGLNPVKPNIMFTMDDSGSMGWDFLPDYVAWVASGSRTAAMASSAAARPSQPGGGYTFSQYDPPVRSAELQLRLLRSVRRLSRRQEVGRHRSAVRGLGCHVRRAVDRGVRERLRQLSGSNNGGTIDLTTAYPDSVWCWKSSATTTDKQTADSNGSMCRRNGRPYSAATVSGNTTPRSTPATTIRTHRRPAPAPRSASSSMSSRSTAIRTTTRSRRVQFCSSKDPQGGERRRARASGIRRRTSTCATERARRRSIRRRSRASTSSRRGSSSTGVGSEPQRPHLCAGDGELRELVRVLPHADPVDESCDGIAFSALDQNSRVGFHTLWENGTLFTNVKDFTAANKQTWFTNAYKVAPNGGTPLPDAMWRVGELFAGNLAGSGLSGATDPLDSLTGKCQPNFHLLSTDGYWNSTLSYTSRGDNDRTVPSLSNLPGAPDSRRARAFRARTSRSSPATSNSLADLAMYYWIRDLRPSVADKVKDSSARGSTSARTDCRSARAERSTIRTASTRVTSGTASWPPATGTGGPEAIDDLWHASINSRGKFFNASNAQQLAESIVGRACRLHRPVRHRHGRRHGRRAIERGEPVRVQDELRNGLWGTSRNTQSTSAPACCRSTPTATRPTRRCGPRQRSSTRRRP